MNALTVKQTPVHFGGKDVSHVWRWRTSYGELIHPKDMVTRHLFNTLRMIWNNTVPEEMRVGTVRLYTFSAHYDRRYLCEAIGQIGRELFTRRDLTEQQKRELKQMESWFAQWSIVDQEYLKEVRYLK